MQISNKAIEMITGNHRILGRLCSQFDRHMKTIENWIDSKDIRLTTPNAVKIIKEETGLNESEILDPEN